MAKSDKQVEFIADFEAIKKGDVRKFSIDIANIFVSDLKVAKFSDKKEIKLNKTNKTDK